MSQLFSTREDAQTLLEAQLNAKLDSVEWSLATDIDATDDRNQQLRLLRGTHYQALSKAQYQSIISQISEFVFRSLEVLWSDEESEARCLHPKVWFRLPNEQDVSEKRPLRAVELVMELGCTKANGEWDDGTVSTYLLDSRRERGFSEQHWSYLISNAMFESIGFTEVALAEAKTEVSTIAAHVAEDCKGLIDTWERSNSNDDLGDQAQSRSEQDKKLKLSEEQRSKLEKAMQSPSVDIVNECQSGARNYRIPESDALTYLVRGFNPIIGKEGYWSTMDVDYKAGEQELFAVQLFGTIDAQCEDGFSGLGYR